MLKYVRIFLIKVWIFHSSIYWVRNGIKCKNKIWFGEIRWGLVHAEQLTVLVKDIVMTAHKLLRKWFTFSCYHYLHDALLPYYAPVMVFQDFYLLSENHIKI